MTKHIRTLLEKDFPHVEALDTGIDDDYIKRVFPRLITGSNRLYGLFLDNQLVSVAGYTIYATSYAMLGRLRSDRRFKGSGFSTELFAHVLHEAFQVEGIQWVGANTQEHNTPAQRVLEKNNLVPQTMLHGARTKDVSQLMTDAEPWNPVTDLKRKKEWVEEMYVKPGGIFPYQCFYPFPSSWDLFSDENLNSWSFYENAEKSRALIIKTDQKRYLFLHALYPWSDITSQPGLWETVTKEYQKLTVGVDEESFIWMDLTKEEAASLPENHPFELPSPWILYGIDKPQWQALEQRMYAKR
ncbi:GNAT family N-acetyltransferase [Lentibacillus sediminis]|uniref:GNAT family N-acetyltransferase n=1 Tax=Lentibacillus sediminis TaxID=1940529 RepID=UPI000C1BE63F|nr:GNAT family N-acetyltransferase [Lentibacillus sediminis]